MKLEDNLKDRSGNYILPFFWQHGESKELLEEGIDRIYESGIRALCVESRPHPDFLGDQWWRDLGIIIKRAESLSMKVWVLDDAHFPSGYCNGLITENSPYRKIYLTHYGADVAGPRRGCFFFVNLKTGEKLIGVLIGRRNPDRPHELSEVTEITANTEAGRVYADIPEGLWTVFVIKTTFEGTGRKKYINTIDRDAVGFFIHEVYEAHYQHFGDEFGKTFAGFFSDEPEIGNCCGEYGFQSCIGQPDMNLPWCDEAEEILRKLWGIDFARNILSLWETLTWPDGSAGPGAERIPQSGPVLSPIRRKEFMDVISGLYSRNFSCQIGDWCRAHGVQYIGHVIEDNGTHTHLGLGTGHYFRALKGQDMAGIDVVLQQLRPDMDSFRFHGIGGKVVYDGKFFHYVLAGLGTSLAALDPQKHGRTMCEIFGAYGWSEGLKMMQWLLNHMLVNGVNWFVPHAFTMKDFPDPDCPPHFYARGMNPQFPYFRNLMQYTNRICHLLQDTRKAARFAVFYPAEQEWMGGEYTRLEDICELLTKNQIEFLIVPEDALLGRRQLVDSAGRFVTDLIVPGSTYISAETAFVLSETAERGIKLWWVGREPQVISSDGSSRRLEDCVREYQKMTLREFSAALERDQYRRITLESPEPQLRYGHFLSEEADYYLFFNASDLQSIQTNIRWKERLLAENPQQTGREDLIFYDAWKNSLEACVLHGDGELALNLAPGEMKIVCRMKTEIPQEWKKEISESLQRQKAFEAVSRQNRFVQKMADHGWRVSAREAGQKDFHFVNSDTLGDFGREHPYFSGTIRCEITFQLESAVHGIQYAELDLGEVYETARVWLNGEETGIVISPPYRFNVDGLLKKGKNSLRIEVTNTLVNRQRDFMSCSMPAEPSGILGPVLLTVISDSQMH